MDGPSYTSNVQPYGSQSGIKFASENDSVKGASDSKDDYRMVQRGDNTARLAQQTQQGQDQALASAVEQSREQQRVSEEQRAKIVEQMSEFVDSFNKGLAFRVDEESGRDVVTIYEASTGDIIRQIPDEEMLEVLRRLSQGQSPTSGLLLTKV
ncbi:flagellar protein FlaG [Vibrio ostreae]|uniref:Flagellar protein FlaG n=1 Tax=Vibrio ostreae TaxID=2841925 RepID=A0A975YP10_9VIBR|nr:flagellar protein FlaG [Vibrio ostreae]QXO18090.1 flagellar protein FlaG [Vibrio ostreae]